MARSMLLSLFAASIIALTSALEDSKHVEVHAWPLSEVKSHVLATIDYNSTSATITSTHAPKISTDEQIVRVGFYQPSTNIWSGIATAADNFGTEKEKVILIHLNSEADVYHVGFRATDKPKAQKGAMKADLEAEVVAMAATPMVQLNKPIVLDAAGQMEQPAEKTFLQKYWWVIAGFLLLQVFMSSSDKKE